MYLKASKNNPRNQNRVIGREIILRGLNTNCKKLVKLFKPINTKNLKQPLECNYQSSYWSSFLWKYPI